MDDISKSLDLLRNTLSKLNIDISDESIEKIKDNGLLDVKESLSELLVNNKLNAVKALTLGKVMSSVEVALKKSAKDLDNTLSSSIDEEAKRSDKLLQNSFQIADIIENALLFGPKKFDAFTKVIENKLTDSENSEELGEILESFKRQEKREMSKDDLERIRLGNETLHKEKLVSLVDMMVDLNKDQLDETLKQSKQLNHLLLAQATSAINPRGGRLRNAIGGALAGSGALVGAKAIAKKLGIIGLAITVVDDAIRTVADKDLKDNSVLSKAITGAITGGKDASVVGGALKYGLLGAAMGSAVPVIGTAIGGALGLVSGAIITYFSKGKIKKIANFFDSIGKKVFSKETWIGTRGIFGKLYNLPSFLDEKFADAWVGIKEFSTWAIDQLTTPFSKEFWMENFEALGNFKDELLSELSIKWAESKEFIIETLTKPFTKEFWQDILSGIGDLRKQIFDNIFGNGVVENKGPRPVGNRVKSSVVIPTQTPNKTIRDIAMEKRKEEMRMNKEEKRKTIANETAIVSQNINSGNVSNVKVQQSLKHGENPTARNFGMRSFGWGN